MKPRQIREKVYWMGAVDWDRRLFDSLIPLPDGTSYNAYLVEGSEKTALLDTVDPKGVEEILDTLEVPPPAVLAALTALELSGRVSVVAGRRYVRRAAGPA